MARMSPGRDDQDAVSDWGGSRGEDVEAPGFESGLDYAAYAEDDDADRTADTEVISDVGPRRAAPVADPGTQPTQSIDRRELDRLAAGDVTGAGAGVAAAPVAADHRGFASGSAAVEPEENRRELRDAEARAAARDEALQGSPTGPRVMQVLLAIFFPLLVLIAAVRLVASPVFLWIEYHRPGFPADQYGFTTGDRLTYGSAGMDYLFNAAPARYLGELQHQGSALFTDAEVSHMTDVKLVMLVTMVVGVVLGLLCIVFMVALSRTAKGGIRRALFAGSVWMLVVLIALGVLAVLGWQQFFAAFHGLFFAEGTWTFQASDALIRLYPNQFWVDAGLVVGVLVLATLVVTLVLTWPTRRRRYDARLAQEDLIRRRNDWADAA
jgi:integral membrane protein (TIGR01906 family)